MVDTDQQAALTPDLGCPRCSRTLAARDYADLAVEECDACGGLFLAPPMLERLVKSRDQPSGLRLALPRRVGTPETVVRYVRCPACNKPMNREAFGRISGVVVDVCRDHGVWFDAGELTRVLEFVEKGGLERAQQRAAEERAEELRRLRAAQASAAHPTLVLPNDDRQDYADFTRDLLRALAELWR